VKAVLVDSNVILDLFLDDPEWAGEGFQESWQRREPGGRPELPALQYAKTG